ncbi:MAG: ureidoglycolate lyase [Pseudomonadota bacterium]
MERLIGAEPLEAAAFAPFGEVIEAVGTPRVINAGRCRRYHDLARVDLAGEDARAALSIFRSEAVTLPYRFDLVERHPLGSQAFVPLGPDPFLVIVAPEGPGRPRAFLTRPGQGVNLGRGVWHGVLTPLDRPADFAVVDREGAGTNLEEHRYDTPWTVTG